MKPGSSKTGDEDTRELAGSGEKPEPTRRERRKSSGPLQRLRDPEVLALLVALVSLLVLFPLRDVLSPVPALPFLAAFALFLFPGFLISRLIPDESYAGPGSVPLAFALSTGVFGLAAIPFLVLHRSFEEYLWACGAVLAGSLILAAFRVWRGTETSYPGEEPESSGAGLMWVPLLGGGAALAYAASRVVPEPNDDHWAYLAYVQEYLRGDNLGAVNPFYGTEQPGFSRLMLNGWLMVQAAFSEVSGIEPVDLASRYLAPALVLVSLLAFYWLARVLFENEAAALLAGALYGVFLLFYLDATPGSFGGDLVRRVLEDKFAARYLMLPVALGLAVLFLRKRGWLRLGTFAFVFWATGAVHPMVLGILGLGVATFGAVHLVANPKSREAWTGALALGAVISLTLVPPAAYLLLTESPLLSRLDTLDPALVENRLRIWEDQERLLVLGESSYIMHPSLVSTPVIAGAYLIGVPFLIWRAGRSLAAQMLLGLLLFFAVLVYFPPVATLAGEYVRPWLIYRLAWPIPLAALLTVAWIVWELLEYATRRFGPERLRAAVPLAALILVVVLAAAAAPRALAGIRTVDAVDEAPQENASCVDPAFDRMRETVDDRSVVLAPALENSCVPAYSSLTNVVSYRDQFQEESASGETEGSGQSRSSRKARDVRSFFESDTVGSAMIETLQRYEVDYVLVPTGTPLAVQLGHLPGFTPRDTPGGRYHFYTVDRDALNVTRAVAGNDALQAGDPNSAIGAYQAALAGGPDEAALAYMGLGLAYEALDSPTEAAAAYEEAIAQAPEEPALYSLLSTAYSEAGESTYAVQALQSGVDRIPNDVKLRTELASLLMFQDAEAAVEVQREAVERFPEVPAYRVKLGTVLAMSGEETLADRQFEKAIRQDPLSAELRADMALANQIAGRDRESLRYYEQALALEPDSPQYNLSVGEIYAELSTGERRDDEYFQRAENHLERAAELDTRPGRINVQSLAYARLGDLYADWDRREQAIDAYEKALEINPEFQGTQQKLEELRRSG